MVTTKHRGSYPFSATSSWIISLEANLSRTKHKHEHCCKKYVYGPCNLSFEFIKKHLHFNLLYNISYNYIQWTKNVVLIKGQLK